MDRLSPELCVVDPVPYIAEVEAPRPYVHGWDARRLILVDQLPRGALPRHAAQGHLDQGYFGSGVNSVPSA